MDFLLWRKGEKGQRGERPVEKILAEIEGLIEECQSVSNEELALLEGRSKVIVVRQGFRSGSVIVLSMVFFLAGVGLGFWLGASNSTMEVVRGEAHNSKIETAPVSKERFPVWFPPSVEAKTDTAKADTAKPVPSGLDSLLEKSRRLRERSSREK